MTPQFTSFHNVHVELTDKCNAKCPLCVRRLKGGKISPIIKNIELGVKYFKQDLGEEFCKQVSLWTFCGTKGDPIACTELLEIMIFLKECNPQTSFSIHTNGGLRSVSWWSALGNFFKDTNSFVVWAIDGLEDTNHIYRRNVNWKKLWENLIAYHDAGGSSIWQLLVFKHNMHQVNEIKEICKEKNIKLDIKNPGGFSISFDPVTNETKIHPMQVYDDDGSLSYIIYPKETEESSSVVIEDTHVPEFGVKQYSPEFVSAKKGDFAVNCKIGTNTANLYIDADGALMPCCFIGSGLYMNGLDPQLSGQFHDRSSFIPKNGNYKDILNNDYFKETLPKGITGDLPGSTAYTIKCIETCGRCIK